MAKRLVFDEPAAGHWVSSICKVPFNPAVDTCIAIERNGKLVGGCLFTQWTGKGGSCTIHVGSDMSGYWATKDFVQAVFFHVFVWLGCEKLFGQVPSSAPQSVVDFNLNLGFQPEFIIPDVYPDGDMILMSMYKRDCRFLVTRPGGHLFG